MRFTRYHSFSADQRPLDPQRLFWQNVRVALSNACMKLAPKLGQEHTMTHILPMLLAFLRDESAEVRVQRGSWPTCEYFRQLRCELFRRVFKVFFRVEHGES